MDRDEPHRDAPAISLEPKPVVAFSVVMALGGDRQISFNGHFGRDDDEAEQNAIIDRILARGDRQKARYDLEKEEAEFRKVGVNLRNLLDGIPIAAANHRAQLEGLKVALEEKEKTRADEFERGYAAARARGVSKYEPKGHTKNALDRMDDDIAKTKARIESQPKDVAQWREQLVKSVLHYQEDLAERRARINAMRHLSGAPALEDFMDEQTANVEAEG